MTSERTDLNSSESGVEGTEILNGTDAGFRPTRFSVHKGDRVSIIASGTILFATNVPFSNGYPRDADGNDEHGKQEYPAGKYGAGHPAPDKIKNSLVLRIGSSLVQAGKCVAFDAPESGTIEMTNNDNDCPDNKQSWSVSITIQSVQPGIPLARNLGNVCVVTDPSGTQLIGVDSAGNKISRLDVAMRAVLQVNHDVFDFVTFVHDPSLWDRRGVSVSSRVYNKDLKGLGLYAPIDDRARYRTKKLRSLHVLTNETLAGTDGQVIRTLLHEFGHHWGVFGPFCESIGAPQQWMHLDPTEKVHWNGMNANAGRSPMTFKETPFIWKPTAVPGVYEAEVLQHEEMIVFNDHDLYFMGLKRPEDVRPMTVFKSVTLLSNSPVPKIRVGSSTTVTAVNFELASGKREPRADASEKHWRHAFVILTKNTQVQPALLAQVDRLRGVFERVFSTATGGLGAVSTLLSPL